ncbi:MAG: ribonuclease Y [Planctomycetota bacterium]|nr:MAG: ribonuclease Y [Planctomycetota bacterium]
MKGQPMVHVLTETTLAQSPAGSASGWILPALIGLLVGVAGTALAVRLITGRLLAGARTEADRIREAARAEAATEAERIRVEAEKDRLERTRAFEKELEAGRAELREVERRLTKREDVLDRKLETLGVKEDALSKQAAELDRREEALRGRAAELDGLIERATEELTRVAEMTRDDARRALLERVEEEVKDEAARTTRRLLEEAEESARDRAREITIQAIQRYASDVVSEATVRSIPIPSDDMKGRIIGREGRNIRAIEKATGVDIIVDDTPGVIVVSCFDKVRQAVAAEAMTRLIADGRIHPARIEEVVAQTQKEIEESVVRHGKDAVLEANLRGVHAKIAEAMGKLHYRTSYGQNVLRHSIEVAFISQMMADLVGLNGAIARRCGFLHDIGKAMDHEVEGGHPKIGMDFAKQFGEKEPVLNAIGGHHGDIPATSFYTPIVMAADALSGARPGARRESLERYIKRLEQLQDIALAHEGVQEAFAIQAGREVRVMVDAKRVGDDQAFVIARAIADRVSDEMTFPGEIKVTVLRETRAIEIAR